MDMCPGGDLYTHLAKYKNSEAKHFTEEMTQFYAASLILALGHLHSKHIVYKDLKLENVRTRALAHAQEHAHSHKGTLLHAQTHTLRHRYAYTYLPTTPRLFWTRKGG